ncbi:MAG TPA: substrate-binding domain-containing protein [Rectinemataceae bacterium]
MAMRRLAFLLASIHSGSSTKVWPEIRSTAERRQCQVFVLPGGRLEAAEEYEYMRNRIYGLARRESFDGALCWASSLSGFASERAVERFLLDSLDLPLVTFGLKIGDRPVVDIDAYSGMRQMVIHLARKHKKKKIAFIGGPRAHSSAEDRYRAYKDALRACGLKLDERLVRLDIPWTEGGKAAASLMDEGALVPGKDFDALCAASDLLLFEAAAQLSERGYSIPGDLALGGFNDSDESNLLSPTYTTVRMPFARQAEQAFSMLLKVLEGEKPQDVRLKTRLVIRQSCGCLPESVLLAQGGRTRACGQGNRARRLGFAESEFERWLKPIESCLEAAASGSPRAPYLACLDRALGEAILRGRDLGAFQDYLSILRTEALSRLDTAGRQRLEVLVGQGRVLVSDAEKRMSNYRLWKERALDHWMNRLNHELLCAKDFPSVVRAAASCLPRLGIPSGWFVLEEGEGGRRSFIGSFESSKDGSQFRPEVCLPERGFEAMGPGIFLPQGRHPQGAGAFVVLPLHYETRPLGYAVLKSGGAEAQVFEEVRAQLSSALRGVLLFEQANRARARAEKAEKLKTGFLAGITGELQEPIRFIRSASARLLSGDEADRLEAIAAIAASSERQMVLTRRLLDLSLAQVDDLSFSPRLFDPAILAEAFARRAEEGGRERGWPSLLPPAESPLPRPCLRGDEERIRQVLEIFMDILGRELKAPALRLRFFPGFSAFGIGIGPEEPEHGRKPGQIESDEGAARLKRLVESEPGSSSAGTARIEIELARRIALLHGASVRSVEGKGLALFLPYPGWEGPAPRGRVPGTLRLAYLGSALFTWPRGAPAQDSPAGEAFRIGLSQAAGDLSELDECDFVHIDPASMDAESWTALDLAAEKQAFRRCPIFLPASALACSRTAAFHESPALLLRSLRPDEAANHLLFLGSETEPGDAGRTLEACLRAKGYRILNCAEPGELAAIARRMEPSLLVILGERTDFIRLLPEVPSCVQVPLVCILGSFADPEFASAAALRPRTIIINSDPVFSSLACERAEALLRGTSLLPAPTGALVSRAIYYINAHYREQISRWKLSEHINASEDYLSRIFRQQMGIPLWDYLGRLRVSKAMELLRASADSVSEIAARCGFQDQAYFCRVFRKISGSTPGIYRKGSESIAASKAAVGADVRKVQ